MGTSFHPEAQNGISQNPSDSESEKHSIPMLHAKTFEDKPFLAPSTRDPMKTFTTSAAIGPAEAATLLVILTQLCTLPWITSIPRIFYVLNFAIWRLNYNLGLGLLLYFQSRSRSISRLISVLPRDARALLHWVVRPAVNPTLNMTGISSPKAYTDLSGYPQDFIAWLAFRCVAACVLANDGVSFALLALAYWLPTISLRSPFAIITAFFSLSLAIPIAAIGVWAKLRAHQSLGDFGWFWGDFFFLLDRNSPTSSQDHQTNDAHIVNGSSITNTTDTTSDLPPNRPEPITSSNTGFVSDGVFAIFPHPMYTAGYLIYFATALAARSSVLLFVASATQISQLLFLYFVEQPHVTKVYEGSSSLTPTSKSDDDDNPALRLFEQSGPHYVTVVVTALVFTAVVFCSTITFRIRSLEISRFTILIIAVIVLWARASYWLFLTYMLSKPKYGEIRWVIWLRHSDTPHSRIFAIWQHVLLLLTFTNHSLFLILAIAASSSPSFFNLSFSSLFDPSVLASTLFAALLIFTGALTSVLAALEAGVFAVYYGDFFLHPGRSRSPCSKPPFSYVRHPDLTLSYLVYYGLAFLARSPFTAAVALICQLMHGVFVSLVEEPHIALLYPEFSTRSSPWVEALLKTPFIAPLLQVASQALGRATQVLLNHAKATSHSVSVRADRARADAAKNMACVNSRATSAFESMSPSDLVQNPRFTAWCSNLRSCLQNLGVDVPTVPNAS